MYVVYIDSITRLKFFLSLKCIYSKPEKIIFIVINKGVYDVLNRKGMKCFLLRKSNNCIDDSCNDVAELCVVEKYYGWSDQEINSYLFQVKKIINKFDDSELVFLIWNSSFIFSKFVKHKYRASSKIYFENSNYNGSAYASYSGTNADLVIDKVLSKEELQQFIPQKEYGFSLYEKAVLGYGKIINKKSYYSYCLTSGFNKIIDKIFWPFLLNFIVSENSKGGVFVPLQIKSDTNIICFYDKTIEEFLEECISKNKNKKITVKFHPKDIDFIWKYKFYKKYKSKVAFTKKDTSDLIENAEKVIVINSTVGFEALLEGKIVDVFGGAYYKAATEAEAKALRNSLDMGIKL